MQPTPDYLNPEIPPNLKRVKIPVIDATNETLKVYGCLVSDPDTFDIQIVRWAVQGWRPIDLDSGDEGGTTEGIFYQRMEGRCFVRPQRCRGKRRHPGVRRRADGSR